jgi:flagellar motor protein MotB
MAQKTRIALIGLGITFATFGQTPSQNSGQPAAHADTVPLYHVTVVDRTVSAVNYQYRGGPTDIGFKGTVLLPKARGDAIVESKTGRTEIQAKFERLEAPARFGAEYLTYVLWAITPDGHAANLGEVVANASDKGHLRVTTEMQAFGMIVTAEPYASVRLPSDVVVLENVMRPNTIGSTKPINARVELLPRGTYTYNVPGQDAALNSGPKVSMSKYEQIVGIYQAQNAVQFAQAQGAGRYAPELIGKAVQQLANARQLEEQHAGRGAVVAAAREAAQTAEDARLLALTRKQETQVKQVQDQAAQEKQLREEAEAKAQQAEAEAQAANDALEAERAQRNQAPPSLLPAPDPLGSAPPAAPAEPVPPPVRAEPPQRGNESQTQSRTSLLQQLDASLGGAFEVIDSPRGVIAIVPDGDFEGARLGASIGALVGHIAVVLESMPGLNVEVDGYTDVAGQNVAGQNLTGQTKESLSNLRAQQVRQALIERGMKTSTVIARDMGSGHPLGPSREENRRVEIVISGPSIGDVPLWDKPYSLDVQKLDVQRLDVQK